MWYFTRCAIPHKTLELQLTLTLKLSFCVWVIFIFSTGTSITARSGWWRETRTTRASPRASTCTRTRRAQGETWMRQVISFDRVKLTNNEMDDKGHVSYPSGGKATL